MSHAELICVLEHELEALLLFEHPSSQFGSVDPNWLLGYAHEDERADVPEGSSQKPEILRALKVCVPARTPRSIVLAPIRTPRMGAGDFPEIMGHVSRLRSHLSEPEQLEIIALLVGPPGAGDDGLWTGVARQLEQNEAIARVFVWLAPMLQDGWRDSAREFLDRVFLRDVSSQDEGARDLAPLEGVLLQGDLSAPERERWRPILGKPIMGAKERASSLLEALAACVEANHGK